MLVLVGTLLPACASAPAATPAPPPVTTDARATGADDALGRAAATITATDVARRVGFLASDELRGRDTPSPGLEKAAEYVAGEFRSFGLQPLGDSGTFIQRWPYRSTTLDPASVTVQATTPQGTTKLAFATDFFLLPSAKIADSAPIVWAGTAAAGMQPPGPQAAGKVVAFFVPGAKLDAAWQVGVASALQPTLAAGPAGILLVLDPGFSAADLALLADQLGSQPGAPAPIVGVSWEAARALFRSAGADLDALRAGGNALVPLTGATLTIRASQTGSETRPPNVVAMLPGTDPALKDTYIVYSAHIDHVGVGAPDATGDSIFNGADDDASGTTALIEVAEAFASLPVQPARSIIFVGVSGEEKGLFGSRHFTDNPPVAATSIVANINMDMIGRNNPDTVVAIGQDYSSLGTLVQEIARAHPELKLAVAPDLWPEEQLFLRSDHFNFARIGVPAIFFTTGLHEQYHEPSDEPELIDNDKLARVAKLVFYLGNAVASRPAAPTWTEAGRAAVRQATGGG
jgi:hypothetical protein